MALYAQEPTQPKSPYVSVIGSVENVDAAAHTISVKTAKGEEKIRFDDRTQFMQLPPGETDAKKATPIKATDVGQGDHMLARVRASDPTGLPAVRCFINKQAEIAQRNQRTLEEWQTERLGHSRIGGPGRKDDHHAGARDGSRSPASRRQGGCQRQSHL